LILHNGFEIRAFLAFIDFCDSKKILSLLLHSLSFIEGIKEEEEKARSQLVLPYITEEQKSGKQKATTSQNIYLVFRISA